MRPQTLISFSIALILGLMTVVVTGTEAALKAKAVPMKSATPTKRAVVKTAKVNVQAVLKPAKTKGKYTLQVILHNPSATKASAFGVRVKYQGRLLPIRLAFKRGLGPRARVTRTLRLNLPKQKGQPCVTVRLTKPLKSKLKLGTSRRTCLKSSMVIRRGIGTTPGRKVRGKRRGIKGSTRIGNAIFAHVGTFTLDKRPGQVPQAVVITVFPGQTLTARWNIPSAQAGNANAVAIRVHLGDFQDIPNECQTGDPADWNSGTRPGLSGSFVIPLASLTLGQTYSVKACLIQQGNGNTGAESHVVTLKYENAPDLVVSDIFMDSQGEIRFKVKNNGPGTKAANSPKIFYFLRILDRTGGGNKLQTQVASAYYTAREQLAPGQEATERTARKFTSDKALEVTVCINQKRSSSVHQIDERPYSNNCILKVFSSQDLTIIDGKFFANIGALPTDTSTFTDPNPKFYLSWGYVIVKNNGSKTARNFNVAINSEPHFGRQISRNISSLRPGRTKRVEIFVRNSEQTNLRDNTSCCNVHAEVDRYNNILESDESNNYFNITSIVRLNN